MQPVHFGTGLHPGVSDFTTSVFEDSVLGRRRGGGGAIEKREEEKGGEGKS